jgi:prolyl oligopeptidase
VFKGASCLPPDDIRCLITLSNGGKDAVTVREFDTTTKTFVGPEVSSCPRASRTYTWLDKDTLLVGREWKPGELTRSGYAYVLKTVKRGQSLDQARKCSGEPTPTSRSARSCCATPTARSWR